MLTRKTFIIRSQIGVHKLGEKGRFSECCVKKGLYLAGTLVCEEYRRVPIWMYKIHPHFLNMERKTSFPLVSLLT